MAYTIERIIAEFHEVCEKAGAPCTVPVKLNGRLSRTLGRVCYVGGTPSMVEFSKIFIETSTDESIRDVLLHEAAHYIVRVRTGKAHGHDAVFKACCAELGTSNDKTTTSVERLKGSKSPHKYIVLCPNCGEIGGYARMCNTLKNIELCSCKKCGNDQLTYKQNW